MKCFRHLRTELVVSNSGIVWCPEGDLELPQYLYGSYYVVEWNDRREYVHILVLEAACHQLARVKDAFPIVDHINQFKTVNDLSNLRPSTLTLNRLNDDSIRGFFRIPGAKKKPFKVEIRHKRKLVFSKTFSFSYHARRAYNYHIANHIALLRHEALELARSQDEWAYVPATVVWELG